MTVADVMREMKILESRSADGFTANDLRRASGASRTIVHQRIRDGIESGAIIHAGWRREARSDGVMGKVPVYRLKREDRRR